MISYAGPIFIFPNRPAKSVGFLADILLLQVAVKRLVWWQRWLVHQLEILEPLAWP